MDATQVEHVADQVRRRRTERGWTLDTAAPRLGISRRLLAQIEAGRANPSLASLLSIAAGFDVPLVELLTKETRPSIVVQDNDTAPILWQAPAGSHGRLLVATSGLELWDWKLQPGEEHRSEPHRPGTREALTVTAGKLTLQLGAHEPVMVRRGQSAAFRADGEHRYANETGRITRFTLTVYEPF